MITVGVGGSSITVRQTMLLDEPASAGKQVDAKVGRDGSPEQQQHCPEPPAGSAPVEKKRHLKSVIIAVIAALVVAGLAFRYFSGRTEDKKPQKHAIPVTVASAVVKTIPLEIDVIGTVQAYSTVQVKSQVVGQLMQVHIKQGDLVKAGDVLFTIDPRQLEAQLEQAKAIEAKDRAQVRQALANVDKDRAMIKQSETSVLKDQMQLKLAQREAQRYLSLVDQGAVSREQYDQQKTTADTASATVRSDESLVASAKAALDADQAVANSLEAQANADHAAVRNMEVQLSYTTIRSPIDGRTGALNINQGNLIKDNDVNSLISIDQVNPIYVSFAIPEQYLHELTADSKSGPLKVTARIEGDDTPEEGLVTFIDNQVDNTTGTITLKGTFANADRRLWPGQFVNVVLILKEQPNSLLIPSHAVQTGQDGQFVFVMKPNKTVEQRKVKLGPPSKGSVVITEGLREGEQVVTDGQVQLTPGAIVQPKKSISDDD